MRDVRVSAGCVLFLFFSVTSFLYPVSKTRETDKEAGLDLLTLSINGRPLRVEIARTPSERQKGLMHRDHIDPDFGMLFVFKEDRILSFWMKDTGIPLSIAFLDKNGKVTDIFDMEPFSLDTVRSSTPCRYAIEAQKGFFRRAGLREGDTVRIDLVE
ncbi:MAG: DUF192 domain-containing protein [Spirochaetes bacterium]|nr:DUF192 domain-containing protein [Spirochaetota bacterium]